MKKANLFGIPILLVNHSHWVQAEATHFHGKDSAVCPGHSVFRNQFCW